MTLERPKVRQLDVLLATVDKIRHAEGQLAALKEQAGREARDLATIPDKSVRIKAGFYAYWLAPEVHAANIGLGAIGRPHACKLLKLAGAVSLGIPCDRCGQDLPIHSRTQMKEMLQEGGKLMPPAPVGHFVVQEMIEAALQAARTGLRC